MGRYPHLGAFEIEGPRDLAIAREALAATGTLRASRTARSRRSAAARSSASSSPRALAQISRRPDAAGALLLLDEPTAALDLAYQLEIAALLRDLQRRAPITIVVSTHDLNFAAGLCRTLVLLRRTARCSRPARPTTC